MLTPIEVPLAYSLSQQGDRYVFGVEVPLSANDSPAWDCSELVEWSCGKAGVRPKVLDGAFNQWTQCKAAGLLIPVARGMATRGALLFVGDGTGSGRNAITHVAWSLGNGLTIEARGKRWGVGCWPSAGRFDFAGLVPGCDYENPGTPLDPEDYDDMPLTDADKGWIKSMFVEVLQSEGITNNADVAAKHLDGIAAGKPEHYTGIDPQLKDIRQDTERIEKAVKALAAAVVGGT